MLDINPFLYLVNKVYPMAKATTAITVHTKKLNPSGCLNL